MDRFDFEMHVNVPTQDLITEKEMGIYIFHVVIIWK